MLNHNMQHLYRIYDNWRTALICWIENFCCSDLIKFVLCAQIAVWPALTPNTDSRYLESTLKKKKKTLDNEYAGTIKKRGLTSSPSLSGECDLLCSMESKAQPVFVGALSEARKSLCHNESGWILLNKNTLIKIIRMLLWSCDTVKIKWIRTQIVFNLLVCFRSPSAGLSKTGLCILWKYVYLDARGCTRCTD